LHWASATVRALARLLTVTGRWKSIEKAIFPGLFGLVESMSEPAGQGFRGFAMAPLTGR